MPKSGDAEVTPPQFHVTEDDEELIIPPVPDDAKCDRMFLPEEFARVQSELGQSFTLDAACNDHGDNRLCERFACPSRSFFDTDVSGERVWINPPYTQIKEWQLHYARCKRKDPEQTSAMFVVPKWSQTELLMRKAGYKLFKTYAQGTVLFNKRTDSGSRQPMAGIPWPVQLWYDPPSKPAQLNEIDLESSRAMVFDAFISQSPCKVLVDTGADCRGSALGFISNELVKHLALRIAPSHTTTVRVANGGKEAILGAISASMRIGNHREHVKLLVLKQGVPGVPVILANDWLEKRKAQMCWASHTLKVSNAHGGISTLSPCHSTSASDDPEVNGVALMNYVTAMLYAASTVDTMSAKKAAKRISQGARSYLMLVRSEFTEEYEPDLTGTDSPPPSDANIPDAKLDNLLKEYSDVFDELKGLPPYRDIGHTIPLVSGAIPPAKRSYRLTQLEQQEVRKQVTELLAKGYIEPSTSPYGAPVIFVEKANNQGLRMVLDYRALNKLTVKRRYPMPNITDLFDQLQGAKLFSSLDLQQGYNQIRIDPEDIPKTAFIAPGLGQFQFKVLCFGLTNAPATFQSVMNGIFADHIGKSVLVYLDDILVFSKTPEEHEQHLRTVLAILRKHEFKAKLAKCQFNRTELHFLGHIISQEGLKVDPRKVKVIREWPVPQDMHKVRSFLGLANYFRRFIQGYSSLVAPLTSLTSAKVPYRWTDECQAAFEGVKHALTHAPVLKLPELDKPFIVWSDASIHGTGAVLLQDDRPVAYTSAKFKPAEYNYSTTDQECLGAIHALEEWRCYLEGSPLVTLVTDHQPLVYLQTKQNADMISRRQARWVERLSRFHFNWEYRPGRINVADPISRIHEQVHKVLTMSIVETDMGKQLKNGYKGDPNLTKELVAKLQLKRTSGFWYHGTQLYVPSVADLRQLIIKEYHDVPFSGHRGISRTKQAIAQTYWWPGMDSDVKAYVTTCPSCQRNKATSQKPAGLLQPLPIPADAWESISMDLITQLPITREGHDAIVVFVDRLSKMTHFAPTTTTVGAEGLAKIFVATVFRQHGLPSSIISDRDTRFTSHFWREVFRLLGTHLYMSTAFHPQTDGQTERMNRVLEETLRHYISPNQDDWDDHLPLIEFAINNSKQRSTGVSPFSLNGAKQPRVPIDLHLKSKVPAADEYQVVMRTRISNAKKCLEAAQNRQKLDADKNRRDVVYEVGQKVLLSTRNIQLKTPGTKKLTPKFIGPYSVVATIGKAAVKLDLPKESRLHPVFHVSLLKPYKEGGTRQPPNPIMIEGEPYYMVESIVDHQDISIRGGRGKTRREYLVKWEGYDSRHNTWEPEESLRESIALEEVIDEYERSLHVSKRKPDPAPTRRSERLKKGA